MRLLLLLSALTICLPSWASGESSMCRDWAGSPVEVSNDPTSAFAALATGKPGAPVILLNPRWVDRFSPPTRKVIFWHECGHHALHHLAEEPITMAQEQEADCFGIRAALTSGAMTFGDLQSVRRDFANLGPGDWEHLPGPRRAMNLDRCLGEGLKPEKWRACKTDYDANVKAIQQAVPILIKMGKICTSYGATSGECGDARALVEKLNVGITNTTRILDETCPFVTGPDFLAAMSKYQITRAAFSVACHHSPP